MNKFALSLSVVVLAGSLQMASAGDITGKITLKGTPPPPITIDYGDICSKMNPSVPTTRHYVVGKENGLANVFVYISKGLEGKKFTPSTQIVELDQNGCNYNPYVFGVMVGQPVRIKNSDPTMHNIHALPKVDGNSEFNFAEPSQGDVNDTKWVENIKQPEVLVKLKCDVHQWMFAYAGVQAHPFFAVSDADGNFKIANVPAGTYTLTAYHLKAHGAKPGETQDITVADSPVTANFTVEVPAPQ
jgi:plastocyanin